MENFTMLRMIAKTILVVFFIHASAHASDVATESHVRGLEDHYLGKRTHFLCSDSSQCHAFDSKMHCREGDGICECGSLYELSNDGRVCQRISCKSGNECPGNFSECAKGYCRCKSGFYRDDDHGECMPSKNACLSSDGCSSDDSRVCGSNQLCECAKGYRRDDHDSNKCHPIRSTTYHHNCANNLGCNGNLGELCSGNQCKCGHNYRYDVNAGQCQYFQCTNSSQCQSIDPNRQCVLGTCYCLWPPFHEDLSVSNNCIDENPPIDENSGVYFLLILLGIFVFIGFVFCFCAKCFFKTQPRVRPNNRVIHRARPKPPPSYPGAGSGQVTSTFQTISPQNLAQTPETPPPSYRECMINCDQ